MVTPPKYLNDPFECSPVIRLKTQTDIRIADEITTSPEFFEKHRNHFPVRTFEEFKSGLLRSVDVLQERLVGEVPAVDSDIQGPVQEIVSEEFRRHLLCGGCP
jgi:hypothetical protein